MTIIYLLIPHIHIHIHIHVKPHKLNIIELKYVLCISLFCINKSIMWIRRVWCILHVWRVILKGVSDNNNEKIIIKINRVSLKLTLF